MPTAGRARRQPGRGARAGACSRTATTACSLTAAGTGGRLWRDVALTAWAGDPLEDRDGFFFYLRDLDTGAVWSVGHQPVRRGARPLPRLPGAPGASTIARLDHEIGARLDGWRSPPTRRSRSGSSRSTITRRRARRIEVTSYAEVVLQSRAPPTPRIPSSRGCSSRPSSWRSAATLLARRRPRGADERHPWLWHALVEGGAARARDRPRALHRPRPLARGAARRSRRGARSPARTGNVLDPIVCPAPRGRAARRAGSAVVTFLLGAEADRGRGARHAGRWASRRGAPATRELERSRRAESARSPCRRARDAGGRRASDRARRPQTPRRGVGAAARRSTEPLLHFNGFGGFTADGTEYVIRLGIATGRRAAAAAAAVGQRHRQRAVRRSRERDRRRLHVERQQPRAPAHARGPTIRCSIRTARRSTCATSERAPRGRRCPGPRAGARPTTRCATASATARCRHESARARAGDRACSCRATIRSRSCGCASTNRGAGAPAHRCIAYQRLVLGVRRRGRAALRS